MSIKDKIENLPDDIVWIAGKEHPSCPGLIGQTIDIQGKQLDHADLKALASSHTALLELLKTRGNDYTSAEDGEIWRAKVKAAIEEAEKL